MRIKLTAPELFGKDAAEDEEADVFEGYVIEREEFARFTDPRFRVLIARAYKGEGKSALLRQTEHRLMNADEDLAPVVVKTTGPALAPSLGDADHDAWVRAWKESILRLVAAEVGSRIGLPFSGEAVALREEADRNGFKSGSLVWSLASRISVEAKGVKVSFSGKGVANPEKVLQRWQKKNPPVWLIVDDIDQNFENTKPFRVKTAAFFTAVRQVTNVIPDMFFRLAIRPNVWAILKREFESLSHVESYAVDLRWSEESMRSLLAQRVYGYLRYTAQLEDAEKQLPRSGPEREKALIALAFQSPMPWGGGDRVRPPHVALHTLSKHRPRWAVELARVAGQHAEGRNSSIIEFQDITSELAQFGRRRIEDTVAEFKSQCPEIDEVLAAFKHQPDLYKTDELFTLIDRRVLQATRPKIVGVLGDATAKDVAHFLFQIGFIYGRRDGANGEYRHVGFAEQPGLLKDRTNLDDGLAWEVHPVFREVLDLHDPARGPRR